MSVTINLGGTGRQVRLSVPEDLEEIEIRFLVRAVLDMGEKVLEMRAAKTGNIITPRKLQG